MIASIGNIYFGYIPLMKAWKYNLREEDIDAMELNDFSNIIETRDSAPVRDSILHDRLGDISGNKPVRPTTKKSAKF